MGDVEARAVTVLKNEIRINWGTSSGVTPEHAVRALSEAGLLADVNAIRALCDESVTFEYCPGFVSRWDLLKVLDEPRPSSAVGPADPWHPAPSGERAVARPVPEAPR